jgi:hypothetical protein
MLRRPFLANPPVPWRGRWPRESPLDNFVFARESRILEEH